MNADKQLDRPTVTLSAKGILLDAEGELELDETPDSAAKFFALALAEVQSNEGQELRFDCTSADGCLLVKEENGWYEMSPLPDSVLRIYYRLFADLLFGAPRRFSVKAFGGLFGYEPTIRCHIEQNRSLHDWEARLKPTAIWFKRIPSRTS